MKDKRDRFVALAEKRVPKAIHALRLVGNLANTNNYAYSDEDAQKILAVLEKELRLLRGRYQAGALKQKPAFKL